MTEKLLKNKNAYEKDKHVYFSVSSFKNYGKLSKKNTEELVAGARVEVSKSKKDPLDFVLWKPSTTEDPSWDLTMGQRKTWLALRVFCYERKISGKKF